MADGRGFAPIGVLTSRIGRRLVALFAGCALLPLLAFAWVTLSRVTEQMDADLRESLHNGAKTAGMGMAARLGQVAADLVVIAELLQQDDAVLQGGAVPPLPDQVAARCSALWLEVGGRQVALRGRPGAPLGALQPAKAAHFAAGKPVVDIVGSPPLLVMARAVGAPAEGRRLVAELGDERFWDPQELRSPGSQFAVLDDQGRVLSHSFEVLPRLEPLLATMAREKSSGTVEWHANGEPHLARYWRAFLRPQYATDLLVVQSRSLHEARRVIDEFVRWFLLTAVCTLMCIVFASLVQMRRTIGPIVSLNEATRRVAHGDLSVRVALRSRDEFGELGAAFNHMTAQLQENVRRREQTERELVSSRDAALAAARAKAEFVTNVSHEFRTPMAEILGATEILAQIDDTDAAARREFAAIALHGATRLARLVDDVLQLGSTAVWETEPVDVAATLRDAVALQPVSLQQRVSLELAPDLPRVQGIEHRLIDVWCRLLDNAAKFSERDAPIEVRAALQRGEVVIEFVDHGVGISRVELSQIFEPFRQFGRDQMTDKAHGTGLGLTLVKNTVDRLGGHIEVDSELGNGSTFRVSLPVAVPAAAVAEVT
ncbi:MAG: HAMP domain-containing histidine kinase [Planctomycetes bacterium]|nr:HAMP domain-containing histidine kinase [Planctomycetota bacterium]